ncbi:glycosyltransferase [Planococcus lenghuensis]|uniref:Glycosyltransferase n=1 Tax=Planococcus lenghuensis TaxID=2213202 RepID=A0A1Q2L1I8_9BACL|nr:glycosyltransferase [Planococcus lenghuensis]AQQ54234.1 hypothetical protein B0X71_14765 [Planococcus lenghuensis]
MRILHILSSDRLSGAENVAADICMMFEGEHESAYCSPDGTIREALGNRNIQFVPLQKVTPTEVRKAIQQFEPDLIHAHDIRATTVAAFVSGKIPVISHLHGNGEEMRRVSPKSVAYLLSVKKVKKIITVSESIAQEYKFGTFIQGRNTFMRNIIYVPRVHKLVQRDSNDYAFDFVYLGRLSYPKNPTRIAEVAASVLQDLPEATFGVIGDGELKEDMVRVFESRGVRDRVVFTGNLPYPYKALKQAKCMLMCSRFEGTPIAALEALALGVPIVSTSVDGMVDMVDDRVTGYLRQENKGLIEAVKSLLTDPNLQKKMKEASVMKFERLNNEGGYRSELNHIYTQAQSKKRKIK